MVEQTVALVLPLFQRVLLQYLIIKEACSDVVLIRETSNSLLRGAETDEVLRKDEVREEVVIPIYLPPTGHVHTDHSLLVLLQQAKHLLVRLSHRRQERESK